jgi:hypothetical protein
VVTRPYHRMGTSYRGRPRQRPSELVPAAERVVGARASARRQARLAALNACWDAKREAVRPLRADAAPDMVAAQQTFSTATRLYGLTV